MKNFKHECNGKEMNASSSLLEKESKACDKCNCQEGVECECPCHEN